MASDATDTPQSLQEVSERLAQVNVDLAASKVRIAELERPLRQEQGRYHDLDDEKERLLQALQVAKRAYFIAQATAECGYATDAQPVIIVRDRNRNRGKFGLPTVWELVAVAPDGTGLYKHAPPKYVNYGGKERNLRPSNGFVIRREAVPQAVVAVVVAAQRATDAIDAFFRSTDYSDERTRRINAMRKDREQAIKDGYGAAGLDRYAEVQFKDDLAVWQARGTGSYGRGSGAYKPLGPPNGGRWRWLKVEEQKDLPVEAVA